MATTKSSFFDRLMGRLDRLDAGGLQQVVEKLAQERSFLETLFNTIEDGVLVVDAAGRIEYFNAAVTRLIGVSSPGGLGQPVSRFLPELDWIKIREMDAGGGVRVGRHELEVSVPRPRFLSLYVAPLDGAAPGRAGLALILHDATEARREKFEAIESERIQALTLLAASVAHEIGNPLNALHIHLQLMERELKKLTLSAANIPDSAPRARGAGTAPATRGEIIARAGKLEEFLGVAKGEITRLDYIVTQFLQAIRPAQPQMRPISLNDVIRESVQLLKPEIQNRGVALKERMARHLPDVLVDPAQVKQVLVNLMKNAIQAMTKGGTLTVGTSFDSEGVRLIVSDTGGGIPLELLNRIYEPFYTTKKKGSGLGLMIVQRIVRDHGGRIELESNVGKGTTFRIWLPRRERATRLLSAPDAGENDAPR